jgi:hypothetical protein
MKSAHIDFVKITIWQINVYHAIQQIVALNEFMGHSDSKWLHGMHIFRIFWVSGVLHHVVSNIVTVIIANNRFIHLAR